MSYDLSPLACPGFEAGRPSPEAAQLSRALERLLRDSRAVDMEALCVQAGKRVWDVRIDVRALDHRGNLFDAGSLAALAAVRHFRRPRVDIGPQGSVTVCSLEEQEGEPLSVHHSPVTLSFGVMDYAIGEDGPLRGGVGTGGSLSSAAGVGAREQRVILDMTDREESVASSVISLSVTAHGELCAVHKLGGAPASSRTVLHCTQVATNAVRALRLRPTVQHSARPIDTMPARPPQAETLCKQLDDALEAADAADQERRYARPATASHAKALGGSLRAEPGTFTAFLRGEVEVEAGGGAVDREGGDSAGVRRGADGVTGARKQAKATAGDISREAANRGILSNAKRGGMEEEEEVQDEATTQGRG